MGAKVLSLLLLVAVVSQGHGLTLITLADETVNHISNDFHGRAITIPKSFLDTLVSCHAIFPAGTNYEVYPQNNLAQSNIDNIHILEATPPFNACGIGFRGVPESASGTYELLSLVKHSDGTESLTRKRFHMNFTVSEVEMP